MHSRLLVAAGLLFVGSCTNLPRQGDSSCLPGGYCTVEGMVVIESVWQASVDGEHDCTALAVPESFYSMRKRFSGKSAQVSGKTFSQPLDEPGTFSYGYMVEQMRVNINNCSMAMIVEKIVTSDGQTWTRSDGEQQHTK